VAFDITKSLATQLMPKAEAPGVADKSVRLRAPIKHEKHDAPTKTFQEEMASEPAKNTRPTKDLNSRPATVRQKAEFGADLTSSTKQTTGQTVERDTLRLDEAIPVGNLPLDGLSENNIQDILQSPVASILAGTLQTLTPEELTSLIGKHELLSSVLFGADSEAVLEQLGEPADVIKAMDLSTDFSTNTDNELKNTAESDLQKINAMQVLAVLGLERTAVLDSDGALKERLLQQNNPVLFGEERPPAIPDLSNGSSLSALTPSPGVNDRLAASVVADPTNLRPNVRGIPANLPSIDEGLFNNTPSSVINNNLYPSEVAQPLAFIQGDGKGFAKNGEAETANGVNSHLGQFDVFKQWRENGSFDLASTGSIGEHQVGDGVNQAGSVVRGNSATFDGFFELGKKIEHLNPEHITTVEGKQVTNQKAPVESFRAPNFMDAVIGKFGMNTVNDNPGMMSSNLTPEALSSVIVNPTNPTAEAVISSESKDVKLNVQSTKDISNFGHQVAAIDSAAPKAVVDQSVRKITVDEFVGDVTAGRINFDFTKSESDSFQGAKDQDSGAFTSERLAFGLAGNEIKAPAFGSEFGSLLEKPDLGSAMTSAQRAELTQKVMDSANYLVREGAGSVKLDLSTADLGSLQIAIKLLDNKVDIKVFTESDPVREAMIADLSRLKDALQTQNVNLSQVQVGVGERFPNSSSFDQSQQFNQQQEFRDIFAENMKESTARAAKELDLRNMTPSSMISRINQVTADGRVQIRI